MAKRLFMTLSLLVAALLTACASAARPEAPLAPPPEPRAAVESFANADAAGEGTFEGGAPGIRGQAAATERLVIRNASLSLVVEDPARTVEEISAMANEMGGFVVNSNVYQDTFREGEVTASRGSISIRVPVERLDEALERIKGEAVEVRNENVTGQDVTDQYTDLASQLRNLEAAESQLMEIMGSATKTEDVLRVFEELKTVRGQIELIKGQMKFFEDSARLSEISVDLTPDVASQPIQPTPWRPAGTVKESVEALVDVLLFLADAAIRIVILVLPVLIILFGPPALVVWLIVRRRRRRRDSEAGTSKGE